GILPKGSTPRIADITDGTSNTILVAESAGRPQLWQAGKAVGAPPTPKVNGGGWSRAANDLSFEGYTQDGTSSPGPCPVNCANGQDYQPYPDPYYGTNGSGGPYGFHTGGLNAVFGDASVHFISASVTATTFAALVTRSGGEVIPSGAF